MQSAMSVKKSCKVKPNFYQLLSLSSEDNVGLHEIKKAYRSKALEFHPDVCPPSSRAESSRKFVEIREAYDTLSDPHSRRVYDYKMSLSDSFFYEDARGDLSNKVWEIQLSGLQKRSLDKLDKKKKKNACA